MVKHVDLAFHVKQLCRVKVNVDGNWLSRG